MRVREKSITRTGQNRTTKIHKSVIFHIFGGKLPRNTIAMKFGTGVDVHEVVKWEKSDLYNLRGVNFTGVKMWDFPSTLPMGLNTV